ncbi:unnamed protein product [Arctogadus glacialis]
MKKKQGTASGKPQQLPGLVTDASTTEDIQRSRRQNIVSGHHSISESPWGMGQGQKTQDYKQLQRCTPCTVNTSNASSYNVELCSSETLQPKRPSPTDLIADAHPPSYFYNGTAMCMCRSISILTVQFL